jgi:hypothetical protein
MLATDAVFQLEMFWLKPDAPLSIEAIDETDATFHLPMSALNAAAPENVEYMLDTDTTFHLPMSALNEAAPENVEYMFDTDATFHLPMSALNVGLSLKTSSRLVTVAVFQSAIWPYCVSPPIHAATVALMLAVVTQREAHVG